MDGAATVAVGAGRSIDAGVLSAGAGEWTIGPGGTVSSDRSLLDAATDPRFISSGTGAAGHGLFPTADLTRDGTLDIAPDPAFALHAGDSFSLPQ